MAPSEEKAALIAAAPAAAVAVDDVIVDVKLRSFLYFKHHIYSVPAHHRNPYRVKLMLIFVRIIVFSGPKSA